MKIMPLTAASLMLLVFLAAIACGQTGIPWIDDLTGHPETKYYDEGIRLEDTDKQTAYDNFNLATIFNL